MPLEWTSDLSVGDEEIDAQHRELFRRVAGLLEATQRGEPEELSGLVQYLHEYAVGHFGAEEARMRGAGYPGYPRHKAEHDRFISDLLAVARDLDRKGPGAFLSLRVNQWLLGWVKEHVSGTDADLAAFLRRRSA